MSDFIEEPVSVSSFLPAEDVQASVEDQLAVIEEDLAAISAQPDEFDLLVQGPDDDPPPIGKGWAFDHALRRFRRGSSGSSPLPTFGDQTLKEWIDKTMRTARGAHPIHPDDYGMEQPFRLIGGPLHGAAISDYEDDLRRALTFHPRISDVRNFSVQSDPDVTALYMTFDVVLDDDTALSFDPFQLP